jgi:hypothetical protein
MIKLSAPGTCSGNWVSTAWEALSTRDSLVISNKEDIPTYLSRKLYLLTTWIDNVSVCNHWASDLSLKHISAHHFAHHPTLPLKKRLPCWANRGHFTKVKGSPRKRKKIPTYTHSAGQLPSQRADRRRTNSAVLKGNTPSKLQRRHRIGPSIKLSLSQNWIQSDSCRVNGQESLQAVNCEQ